MCMYHTIKLCCSCLYSCVFVISLKHLLLYLVYLNFSYASFVKVNQNSELMNGAFTNKNSPYRKITVVWNNCIQRYYNSNSKKIKSIIAMTSLTNDVWNRIKNRKIFYIHRTINKSNYYNTYKIKKGKTQRLYVLVYRRRTKVSKKSNW